MKGIFKDGNLQHDHDHLGYAKFKFLDDDQIDELVGFYRELKPSLRFSDGLHITVEMEDPEMKKKVQDRLAAIMAPSFERIFRDHDYMLHGYVIKAVGATDCVIGMHQDWTFVAEEKGYSSGTFWIALNDVPKARGGISFIPGSHRWSDHFRYTPKEIATMPFYDHGEMIMEYAKFEDLKAGEAFLWDNRTLHASKGNFTDEDRMVIAMVVTHRDAPKVLHCLDPADRNTVGVYEADSDLFHKYSSTALHELFLAGKTPNDLKPAWTYPLTLGQFSAERLEDALKREDFYNVTKEDLREKEAVSVEEPASEGFFSKVGSLFRN